jgi:prepilin-type N-terminal cleavage/methylation domain-containing protein
VRSKYQSGITLIEIAVVVVIVGIMAGIAIPSFRSMQDDADLRSGARAIANAFNLAKSHAIQSGDNVIVVFQSASGSSPPTELQSTSTIDIIGDGPANSADCAITNTAEILDSFTPSDGLSWGTTPALAGTNTVPTDPGLAPSNASQGSTFTDATVMGPTLDASKFASWVVFQPDGIPRLMTPGDCANLGTAGRGGGGIYLTNGRRDYAVVMTPMGSVRVHYWNGGSWTQ